MIYALSPYPLIGIAAWLRWRCTPRMRSPFVLLLLAHVIEALLHWAMLLYGCGVTALADAWAWR